MSSPLDVTPPPMVMVAAKYLGLFGQISTFRILCPTPLLLCHSNSLISLPMGRILRQILERNDPSFEFPPQTVVRVSLPSDFMNAQKSDATMRIPDDLLKQLSRFIATKGHSWRNTRQSHAPPSSSIHRTFHCRELLLFLAREIFPPTMMLTAMCCFYLKHKCGSNPAFYVFLTLGEFYVSSNSKSGWCAFTSAGATEK